MISRSVYTFMAEPRGQSYEELLTFCASLASEVGLTVSSESFKWPNESREAALKKLAPHLARSEVVDSWPGTWVAPPGTATLFIYEPSEPLLVLLRTMAAGLFEWVNPNMPDDLHFLREDGSVILGCIGTEDDGWLELDEVELDTARNLPSLAKVLPDTPD